LLSIDEVGIYLGVSPWTIRDLVAAGQLRPVRLPGIGGKEIRRLLFDRHQLDQLVESAQS
jgi:excisionase family DNA binding protein